MLMTKRLEIMNHRNWIRQNAAIVLLAAILLGGCGSDKPEALLASAKNYLAKDDPKTAIIQLRTALQKNPSLAEARFLLGAALLDTGSIPASEKELRKALELDYPADQVVPTLVRVMVADGQYKKAIDEFGSASIRSPQANAELQSALGQAYFATGNASAGKAAFEAALAAQPDYPPAILGAAQQKVASGDVPGALASIDAGLAKSPKFAEGWQFKGNLLLAQGRQDDALGAYRQALSTNSSYLPAHFAIVSLLARQGKVDDALKQFATLQKIAPKQPETLYLQALLAYKQKNLAAAHEAIQQYLQSAPDTLRGLLLAGTIDFELKSYAQAEASLRKVVQRAPDNTYARRLLAATYLRTDQRSKAQDVLQPLLDHGTNDARLLALAGEVFMQNGEVDKAARYFERAAALDPKNTPLQTTLALSHVAAGETERGFRELEEAATSDTRMSSDLALVAANIRRREFDKALVAIAALEKKQPESPLPHTLRGGVLEAKKDVVGARASFERALVLDPAFVPAATRLAQLDLADNKPEDAKRRFEAVLRKDPKNTSALLALAELRERGGAQASEVVGLYTDAVAADPTQSTPRQVLISYHLRHNEPKKAVAVAQEAVTALPDRPELLDALGRAQQRAGETNQARATFTKLAQLRPSSPVPQLRIADVQIATKDDAAALATLRKALALDPRLLQAQVAIVALEVRAGHTAQALVMAREVQKQRPKESVGFILEGDVHSSRKAWTEAIAAYRLGLKQVGTPDLAARLYAVLDESGSREASKFATTWLKEHPNDVFFRRFLAQAAISKKDYAGAIQNYRVLLEMQPNNAVWLNNLAWAAGQAKDPKALEYAELANKLAPDQPEIMDTLGTLLIDGGDTARGVELLQKASAKAPSEPGVRLSLAKGLIRAGQRDAAKKELEILAKLGDKFPRQAEVTQLMKEL